MPSSAPFGGESEWRKVRELRLDVSYQLDEIIRSRDLGRADRTVDVLADDERLFRLDLAGMVVRGAVGVARVAVGVAVGQLEPIHRLCRCDLVPVRIVFRGQLVERQRPLIGSRRGRIGGAIECDDVRKLAGGEVGVKFGVIACHELEREVQVLLDLLSDLGLHRRIPPGLVDIPDEVLLGGGIGLPGRGSRVDLDARRWKLGHGRAAAGPAATGQAGDCAGKAEAAGKDRTPTDDIRSLHCMSPL